MRRLGRLGTAVLFVASAVGVGIAAARAADPGGEVREAAPFGAEVGAHERGKLALHHADQGLARRERADDFLAQGFFLDARDEFAHRGQGDVGFEQGQPDFAQHLGGIRFGQAGFAAHGFDDLGQPLGEIVEHDGSDIYQETGEGRRRGRSRVCSFYPIGAGA